MKSVVLSFLSIVFILFIFVSCSDTNPITRTESLLLRSYEVVTSAGKLRGEFSYRDNGDVARIDWRRETPNVTQGSDVYTYDADGNVSELVRSITGLHDERIVYRFENGKISISEHYVNGERLSYLLYDYDENGRLKHSEENNRIPGGGGHARGTEFEYFYSNEGNLSQIKEYSFNESNAQLILESTHTFSNFTRNINPLQPIDPLPNITFQKNLPTTLTLEAGGLTKLYVYQYTMRPDGYPSKRVALVHDATVETVTYEY